MLCVKKKKLLLQCVHVGICIAKVHICTQHKYMLWILHYIFTYQHAVGDLKSALSAGHLLKAEMAWVSITTDMNSQ